MQPVSGDRPIEGQEDASEDALLLPALEDRERLAKEMAGLIAKHGFSRFVNAPLLAPNETFFPDPWRGGQASVNRVARRLLGYAELGHAPVEVEIHDEAPARRESPAGKPVLRGTSELQVWYRKRKDKSYLFGAESVGLRDPHLFVASMARAVTWAWLLESGHKIDEEPERQRIVDVATVYMGFGVMTTEAALRHGAENTGGFSAKRTKTRLGLLSPRAMAFCLALQVASRRLDKKSRKHLESFLQPNKVAFLRASLNWLAAHPEFLDQLGIPAESTWPPPSDLRPYTGPMSGDDGDESEERRDLDRGMLGVNEGKPVFRVVRNMTARLVKASMLLVSVGAMSARSQGGPSVSMGEIMIGAAGLMLLSVIIGPMFRESRCSEPKCATPLTPEMEVCPTCAGTIAWVIDHPKKRLAAEEEYEEKLRGEAGESPAPGTG
jgi:hypothetical protein